MRYLIITVVLSAALLGGLRTLFSTVLRQSFAGEELVYGMRSLINFSEPRIVKQAELRDDAGRETVIDPQCDQKARRSARRRVYRSTSLRVFKPRA